MSNEDYKVAEDVAEAEFNRFAELMDLDLNTSAMDDEDLKNFNKQKRIIIRAIMRGTLTINDKGEPVYECSSDESKDDVAPIIFYEPTGASLTGMDNGKVKDPVKQMHIVMGNITKTHASLFANMLQRDHRVCVAIATFFLG